MLITKEDLLESHSPVNFLPPVQWQQGMNGDPINKHKRISIYVHIPFCKEKCSYCSFLVIKGRKVTPELIEEYISALIAELCHYAQKLNYYYTKIISIQFGGGTPSILSSSQINRILAAVTEHFNCSELNEIIFEAFPTSMTDEKLEFLSSFPNVKLNIGIQSFDDSQLLSVGRKHTAHEAIQLLQKANYNQIKSVGIDLICGLPNSTSQTTESDIHTAIELGVDHFAIYPLWLYPDTKLYHDVQNERLSVFSYAARKERLMQAEQILKDYGYERYTIFHYKKVDEHYYGKSQMMGEDWLGIGIGALSQINHVIWQNTSNISGYLSIGKTKVNNLEGYYQLNVYEEMQRTFLSGLRLSSYDIRTFNNRFGLDIECLFHDEIEYMHAKGYLDRKGAEISLTVDGILNLNEIESYITKKAGKFNG